MTLQQTAEAFLIWGVSSEQMKRSCTAYEEALSAENDAEAIIRVLEWDRDKMEIPPFLALATCDKLLTLARHDKRAASLCSFFIYLYDETRDEEVVQLRREAGEE